MIVHEATTQAQNIKIKKSTKAKPYHATSFMIPKIHEETRKTEVNKLIRLGVLKRKNKFKWAALTFVIPKTKWNSSFHFSF